MIGLDAEELNLLLLHGEQHPASCSYRAASLVFEAFLQRGLSEIGRDRSSASWRTPKTFNPHLYQTVSKREFCRVQTGPKSRSARRRSKAFGLDVAADCSRVAVLRWRSTYYQTPSREIIPGNGASGIPNSRKS